MNYRYTHQWTRRETIKKEQGTQASAYSLSPYRNERIAVERFTDYSGEFEITIDTERLAARLASAAAHTKNGKSTLGSGIIKCRKVTQRQTGQRERVNPCPVGFTPDTDAPPRG